ncbi:MAG: type I-B CRISPR-associated protein Cas5b [Fervidobacterium sp.]
MDRVIVFEISSKMAHFRKFYTNSSSLSYFFPPKTTLAGMIAAFLGYQKDSYYELFDESAKIAVEIVNPLRKKIQVVNYLFVKSPSDLSGISGGTQIPLEFVLPVKFEEDVVYRIYFFHQNLEIYMDLKRTLEQEKYRYPLYMGLSELPAVARYIGEFEVNMFSSDKEVEIVSVIPSESISNVAKIMQKNKSIYKDRMPVEFTRERKLRKVKDYIFNPDGSTICTTLSTNYYLVKDLGKNIIPM